MAVASLQMMCAASSSVAMRYDHMTSGQYLQMAVRQLGIDVLVALYTPDGKKIDDADTVRTTAGSETISAIAEAAGAYIVEARSAEKTAQTGRYEIKVEELRVATAEDKYLVAGDTVFREAERLGKGTREDRRKSIEKYHEAFGRGIPPFADLFMPESPLAAFKGKPLNGVWVLRISDVFAQDDGSVVGSAPVISGMATLPYTISLAQGSYPIVATYSSSSTALK